MNSGQVAWDVARVAAMSAFFVMAVAVLTGMAIRTAYLAPLARNRSLLSLHKFLTWLWIPLMAVHIGALLLDAAAGIGWVDVLIPFRVHYATNAGTATLAIGLGTCGFLLVLFVGITAALRKRMSQRLWRWIHRLTYPMFAVFLVHAQLAGTDFSRTAVSVIAWAAAGLLLMLAMPRVVGGRMDTEPLQD